MPSLLEGLAKAIETLQVHDVVPGSFEVTRTTFEQLKRECRWHDPIHEPKTFMGVRIVIKD